MISKEILEQLKQASANATPGEWEFKYWTDVEKWSVFNAREYFLTKYQEDAEFIVLARNYLDPLIARVEELELINSFPQSHKEAKLTAENTRLLDDADRMREALEKYKDVVWQMRPEGPVWAARECLASLDAREEKKS